MESQILRHPPLAADNSLPPSNSAELVSCVARALTLAIESPRRPASPNAEATPPGIFDSSVVPNVTVERYLTRLKKYFQCSDAVFVLALIMVDRLLEKNDVEPNRITTRNVHRLYLASLIVTVKYNEDLVYGNSHYARSGGIMLREVNRLERFFAWALDFDFHVFPEQYNLYERSLRELRSQLDAPQIKSLEAPPSPLKCAPPSRGKAHDLEAKQVGGYATTAVTPPYSAGEMVVSSTMPDGSGSQPC
jgi:hypothetical protein